MAGSRHSFDTPKNAQFTATHGSLVLAAGETRTSQSSAALETDPTPQLSSLSGVKTVIPAPVGRAIAICAELGDVIEILNIVGPMKIE